MKETFTVFRMQGKLFLRDKGMLLFYFIIILISGVILPFFYQGWEMIISLIALITIMLTKPILADSFAGEREHKTLESMLSTSIMGKNIIWGKIAFSLFFAVFFHMITTVFAILTFHFSAYPMKLMGWQWISIFIGLFLNLSTICISGVYRSVLSENSYIANSKISKVTYGLLLLQVVYLSIVFQTDIITTLIIAVSFLLIELFVICRYLYKISRMEQADFFNQIETAKQNTAKIDEKWNLSPRTQLGTVLRHELKYLLQLKTLLINFMILCISPAIVVCIFKYYFGTVNLYYGVILTTLMMPRAPINLISYSIGGEKAYKTGESLLSTPIHIMPLFLAKCMVPVFISTIMLLLSSLLTLLGANIIGVVLESGRTYFYTLDQLMLLFPIGIMSCITMVLITGIFSLSLKTPRQGLYVSSIIGVVFMIPLLIIVYMTQNPFLWSVIYFVLLLLGNIVSVKGLFCKINRPFIMERL